MSGRERGRGSTEYGGARGGEVIRYLHLMSGRVEERKRGRKGGREEGREGERERGREGGREGMKGG